MEKIFLNLKNCPCFRLNPEWQIDLLIVLSGTVVHMEMLGSAVFHRGRGNFI